MADSAILESGFTNPVLNAQSVFRAVMQAMAEPGTAQPVDTGLGAPEPLTGTLAALIQTLCDTDTPIWLDQILSDPDGIAAWIGFHTGAAVTPDPGQARFAVLSTMGNLLPLDRFSLGTDAYPDRSTTLFVATPSLDDGPVWHMTGPGIDGERKRPLGGLGTDFGHAWHENAILFPRGIDIVLAAPDQVLALPRSVQLRMREA